MSDSIDATSPVVEAIQDSVKTVEIEVAGGKYATRPVYLPPVPHKRNRSEFLATHTLDSVVDYIKANRDQLNLDETVVHVLDPWRVQVRSALHEDERNREDFVLAAIDDQFKQNGLRFQFGTYDEPQDVTIALQTMFKPTDELDAVIKLVANIRKESACTVTDDGKSQSIVTRTGIAKVGDVEVPNPIALVPLRSFPEIDPPSAQFLLRFEAGDDGEMPSVAIWEVDALAWKLRAIRGIKNYLTKSLSPEGVTILG